MKNYRKSLYYALQAENVVVKFLESLENENEEEEEDREKEEEQKRSVNGWKGFADRVERGSGETAQDMDKDNEKRSAGWESSLPYSGLERLGAGYSPLNCHGDLNCQTLDLSILEWDAVHTDEQRNNDNNNNNNNISTVERAGVHFIHRYAVPVRDVKQSAVQDSTIKSFKKSDSKKVKTRIENAEDISSYLEHLDRTNDHSKTGELAIELACGIFSTGARVRSHLINPDLQPQFRPTKKESVELNRMEEIYRIVGRPYCTESNGQKSNHAVAAVEALWGFYSMKSQRDDYQLQEFITRRGWYFFNLFFFFYRYFQDSPFPKNFDENSYLHKFQ